MLVIFFVSKIILYSRDKFQRYVVYNVLFSELQTTVEALLWDKRAVQAWSQPVHMKASLHFCPRLPSVYGTGSLTHFDICPALMCTGATCEVQIDECQSQPCLNGGSCHDYISGFTCTCLSGFQGHRCEINTDECQEQPCQNRALCIDGVNE